jgi:hypothetical protein
MFSHDGDADRAGVSAGVAHDVGQRLLDDAVSRHLDSGRQGWQHPLDVDGHPRFGGVGAGSLAEPLNGPAESEFVMSWKLVTAAVVPAVTAAMVDTSPMP